MEETKEERTQELKHKIRQTEDEREKLSHHAKQIMQEEEEEDVELGYSRNVLSGIARDFSSANKKILSLLDEKEYVMQTFRRKKTEFDGQFHEEVRKKKQRLEDDREELQQKMTHLKYNEKEER